MPFIRRYIARVLWGIHNARHDTINISNIVVRGRGGGLFNVYMIYFLIILKKFNTKITIVLQIVETYFYLKYK